MPRINVYTSDWNYEDGTLFSHLRSEIEHRNTIYLYNDNGRFDRIIEDLQDLYNYENDIRSRGQIN